MKARTASCALSFAAFVVACGGSAPPTAASPSSPEHESTSAPDSTLANPRLENPTMTPSNVNVNVGAARSEVDRAESQLNAAMSDCAAACRALASMERAAEHLCALDSGTECGRARERLEAARERIRATCGGGCR